MEGGSHGRWPINGTSFCGLSIALMYLIIWDFFNSEVKKKKREFHLQIKVPVSIHWKHIARPRITGKLT